jgi:hypothetical protein
MHSAVIDARTGRKGVDGPMEWKHLPWNRSPAAWELVIPLLFDGQRVGELRTAIIAYDTGALQWNDNRWLIFDSVEEAKAYAEVTYALEE